MRRTVALAVAVPTVAWLLAGCEAGTPPQPAREWTLYDLDRAFAAQEPVLVGAEGLPGGMPYNAFVKGPGPLVPIVSAFTEKSYAAYVTTNVWANIPEIWIQPMYILVSEWNNETHRWKVLGAPENPAPWVFTVGPGSRFHSPFWRVYYAEAPPGTPPTAYTSSEQILRDKLPLHPGPGRLISIVPTGTTINPLPARPPSLPAVKAPTVRAKDFLDGEVVGAIDFGENRFEWRDDLSVVEQPFFVLVTCPDRDDCAPSGAPNVGATGPLFEGRPAIAPGNRPRFGSLWRLHLVKLPAGDDLGLYIPPSVDDGTREQIRSALYGLSAPPLAFVPDPLKVPEMDVHFMQVALNAGQCFQSQEAFGKCIWIDSQQAVEENLAGSITRTGVTVTCPFIYYEGMDVPK